ncbi:hypothetical protein DFH94DRAFT_387909 [Russula ochroleuca]|uniref:Ribonuclease H1 N-terminal domain-containing protein n=1 Tax=Russula ochroleuca TaxID=152965 RepID=A0A9P5TB06_9AGAM|nr:hypothetical protein DFH94DRAFT_387909 [Russula ochroleuca]
MAKGYYTVIVGTQPGVYADWTQAAPKVTEIPGNIHKKFKTLAEAWAAYHQAAREGRVRAVRLYPEPEAESPPGSQIQEEALHDYPVVQVQPTFHSATGPGQRFHRSHAAGPMGVGKMTSMGAGPSHLTERMSHDAEPREHHNFGQQYCKVPTYM